MSEVRGKQWVLLVSGSKGWPNYRHQANVCHAYQIVHQNGIPDEQIVVMMYDDIAYNEENPHPGEVINEPSGLNVYPGVLKDYTGADVSASNFLAVLRGDAEGVTKQAEGPKKVLKSDENDTIFVYLSDHGATGVFAFPREFLHASDFVCTVSEMAGRQQFSKMIIYMESCCSGSMMEFLPKNVQVYGVSASAACESHSACFYDEDRHTFLAGEFTSCWLFHNQMSDLTKTSFQDQFVYLQQNVTQSTPCHYGNNELSKLPISDFLGSSDPHTQSPYVSSTVALKPTHLTPCREVTLVILQIKIQRESDPKKKEALQTNYDNILQMRTKIKEAVQAIAQYACPDGDFTALMDRCTLTRLTDMKDVAEHYRGAFSEWHENQHDAFVLSHMPLFVNLLESGVKVSRIKDAITHVSSLQGFC